MKKRQHGARNRGNPAIKIVIRKFLVTHLKLCRLQFSLYIQTAVNYKFNKKG
ncbi:hypothetical protein LR48_Vigan442s004500 [Vigna angularis]|uniref:Uncharacterized protein n=1 Tax=Phaseolus angularis TaxID=3914 RepID=A0A0L9TBV5_PHAAN|nr:hypothetical protein LR48_Vigan442s004500 [Vigna angularis]